MAQEDSASPVVDYSKPLPSRRELRRREEEARRANRRGLFGRRKAAPSSTPPEPEHAVSAEPEFVVAEPALPEADSAAETAEKPAEADSAELSAAPPAAAGLDAPTAEDAPPAEDAAESADAADEPVPDPASAVEPTDAAVEPTAEPTPDSDAESAPDADAPAEAVPASAASTDSDDEPTAEPDSEDAAEPVAASAKKAPADAESAAADEPSDSDGDAAVEDAPATTPHSHEKAEEPAPRTAGIPVGHGLVTPTPAATRAAEKDYGRAGRNLPAAIGVGLLLGGGVLASLLLYPPSFLAIVVIGIGATVWELANALSRSGSLVSRVPTVTAALCMVLATYFGGREALWVAFAAGAGTVVLFTLIEKRGNAVKDVCLSLFALTYVGLMASFVVYMLTLERGNLLVILFLALVVSSDIGGYAAGVLFGKHPIAPRISPKKSWEGFAGSAVLATVVGVCMALFVFDAPVWTAVVLGVVIPAFATLGDFSESMIKRDLDLKDMGTLLPGHGGVMDRLDSILPTAPVVLLLLSFLPGYIAPQV